MKERDVECDVLVIGTGASGMATAVTAASQGLKVLVVEKEPRYGGTTARSGGWLWIPGTRLATEQGINEPARRGARRTCSTRPRRTSTRPASTPSWRTARRRSTSSLARRVCSSTCRLSSRTTTPRRLAASRADARWSLGPFDGRELGQRIKQLAPPLPELTVFGMMLGSGKEIRHFMRAFKSLESFVYVTKRLGRHMLDVLRHGRGMTLTNGNALAGRLAKAAMDLGHPGLAISPVHKLVVEDDGVAGAFVSTRRQAHHASMRSVGVVLACGGFPHDVERRKALFPHAPTGKEHYSPAPEANTGDGLRLAEAVGGTRRRRRSRMPRPGCRPR